MRRLKLMPKLVMVFLAVSLVPLLVLGLFLCYAMLARAGVDLSLQVTIAAFGLIAAAVTALGLTAGAAAIFRRSIVEPINRLQASALQLSAGDFPTFELHADAEQELAELAAALRETSAGLHALFIEADMHTKDTERLYAEAYRRATALQIIHNVSQRISTILDLDELLTEIVKLVRSGFDYDHINLFAIDRVTREIVFYAGAGRSGEISARAVERIRISSDNTIGHVASTGRHLLVQDFEQEPRYRPHSVKTPGGYVLSPEVRSELVVPLSSGNQLIGVLSVYSGKVNAFSDYDLFVLQELAYQAAGAIVNARLYEEAFRRAEEIVALMMTSLALSTVPDLAVRLEAIAYHAGQLTNADGCTVYRLDAQTNVLYPLVSHDPRSETMMAAHIQAGTGLIGQVVQSGQGAIVNHPERLDVPWALDEPECLIAVPLLVADRRIGVMIVRRQGASAFAAHDLELLTLFASQAAVAIESAELYQQLRDRAEVLQRAYKQLEEADKLKDEMIQNISHELRTPLTFIVGYMGLLIDGDMGQLNSRQHESMQLVYEKVNVLTRMVDAVITLQTVRLTPPQLVPLDIVVLAQRAAEIAQAQSIANNMNIQVGSEFSSEVVYVMGEPAYLTQVMENILNNAVKFSPDGGQVIVRVVESVDDDPEVRVEIEDSGIGIPVDKLEKVFERFYQVDGTSTRRFGGIGMGLAICKEVVEALGGRVWVESPTRSDHGSKFCFTLQKASSEQARDAG
ncbi:MAG: GAF domain-containing protein [Thermoflexales bacterium]|nr:GAF domain-containing protein [Thermoflexales bacterium]